LRQRKIKRRNVWGHATMNEANSRTDRYARANVMACALHARQTRDDGKTPYSVHPVRVAEHLRRIAEERDEDVLIAALLHDTLEDCAITFEVISSQFGENVASLVAELTNDNRLPKPKRRAAMIEHLPQLSSKAKRIKLSDRYDNVLDLLAGGGTAEKKARYCGETERILTACQGACGPLESALKAALEQLKKSA
jgi:GTP diphosphokinase / guanosine-3',5'-bis(diphosphate) 3'-diphosphatase